MPKLIWVFNEWQAILLVLLKCILMRQRNHASTEKCCQKRGWELLPISSCKLLPINNTVKPVLSCHSKIHKTRVLKPCGSLMQVKSTAEGSILQYFWPALSDYWSWKPIFGLLLSGHLRQAYWYWKCYLNLMSVMTANLCNIPKDAVSKPKLAHFYYHSGKY